MDDKTKQDFIQLFNKGFEEIVLPRFKEIDSRLKVIQNDVDELKLSVHRLENSFDKLSEKVNNHEQRIAKLEATSAPHPLN